MYPPRVSRAASSSPRVSVVTPTYGRERFLPLLLDCFRSQTCAPLELLVLDDSPAPSTFLEAEAARDPRVVYLRGTSGRATNGAKRRTLIEAARGDYVAYFDDDDYYAPDYLAFMMEALGPDDLVKLGAWFNYWAADGRLYYWDARVTAPVHFGVPSHPSSGLCGSIAPNPELRRSFEWGYGFSYVFRREMGLKLGVDDMNHGADYAFVRRAEAAGYRLRAVPDEAGVAAHVLHGQQVSRVFPQYVIPPFLAPRALRDALERYREAAEAPQTRAGQPPPTAS